MARREGRNKPDSWAKMLAALAAFRKKHGHCKVPANYKPCPALGRWAAAQRYKRKIGELSPERVKALDRLGFVWAPAEETWTRMIEDLKAFKSKFGHTNVPEHWAENPTLANWVQSQRYKRKKGKLSEERVRELTRLGFMWSVYRNADETSLPSGKRQDSGQDDGFSGERLYVIRHGVYVQHDGKSPLPKQIEQFQSAHRGDLPPFIPLPKGPTVFCLGDAFVKEKKVKWRGKGPLPSEVMDYVQRNGTLPKYEPSAT